MSKDKKSSFLSNVYSFIFELCQPTNYKKLGQKETDIEPMQKNKQVNFKLNPVETEGFKNSNNFRGVIKKGILRNSNYK
jgi:hypothetical protein